ncbi:GTP 3',8-cyclase MoaA [Halopseudomonas bauzanensis]|uniref:GTP 3',8-cyclase n=1 Tax=Halopseudomonas bauzanensis TaxID=653930 RepID=A0A4U0YLH3_9GAMM|nr:GTP 3',8-cyclase MoaA [Halopseudomonas bauzanensis]TKA92158.1 GTP 3',8-cyclase MoaA [Halopseudomonas bauzanensis]
MDMATSPLLQDRFGRSKRKLRLSLTDRCNFRCRYCMPEHPQWLPGRELMDRQELVRLATLFVDAGIEEIRLTGGEPLLRKDVVACVAALSRLRERGLKRLSMTTNGTRLPVLFDDLIEAGLDDLNISLDAVDEVRFQALTRSPLAPVLAGIERARDRGIAVKLNAVLIQDYNHDQILPLVAWARSRQLPLRFIEYMPLDEPGRWQAGQVVSEAQILGVLEQFHHVQALPRSSNPATQYRLDGDYTVGVISTVTRPFCASCDRLRLTANGHLYTCLFSRQGHDLLTPLRSGEDDRALRQRITQRVWHKDAGYAATPGPVARLITMHGMGG